MDLTLWLLVGLVLCTAAVIQGAAGFAFGLFATPVLLLLGLMPEQAIAMVATSATCQSAMGIWRFRDHVHWRLVAKVGPVAVLSLPLGVWLLGQMSSMGDAVVRQIFGGIVLGALVIQWLWRVQPRDHLPLGWSVAAMVGAGVGTGAAGMAGPATAMWVTAHTWTSEQARSTMWAIFLLVTPPNMLFLYLRFGAVVGESVWQGSVYLPAVILATLPGLWLGSRMGMAAMRRAATALLIAIGTYCVLYPFISPAA